MKKWVLAGVMVLLLCLAAFSAGAEEAFELWVTPMEGEAETRLYEKPDGKSNVVGKVLFGQRLKVTGGKGNFYQVEWQDKTVFASRQRWELISQIPPEPDQLPLPEAQQPVGLETLLFSAGKQQPLPLRGIVEMSQPVTALCLYVYDSWQMGLERCLTASLAAPVQTLDLSACSELFSARDILPGWKKLYITAVCGGEQYLIGRAECYMMGEGNAPQTMNDCVTMPNKQELTDDRMGTGWTSEQKGGTLRIDIPAGHTVALMALEWRAPAAFRCTQKDGQGRLIAQQDFDTGFYADAVPLAENTRQIELTILSDQATLSTLNLYAPGYSELAVQQWEPMPQQLDILFIATHQDDEILFFGGGIPYYAASGYATGVLYTANCGRSRLHEALDGLWTAGLKNHPIFLPYRDSYSQTLERAMKNCDVDALTRDLVAVLRQYQPKVVVTQDFEGEYGHGQHRLTAALVAKALPLAADPHYDEASAAAYGTWQVQKLYVHLYAEQEIIMDWEQPLREGSAVTPIMLAKAAYSRHFSQNEEFTMEKHGVMYDNRKFGLYFSAVGPDEACNDFMEHVQ